MISFRRPHRLPLAKSWLATFLIAAALQLPALIAANLFGPRPAFAQDAPTEKLKRDNDRLRILTDEQAAEHDKLAASQRRLQARTAAGDAEGILEAKGAIGQHQRNLELLTRELAATVSPAERSPTASGAYSSASAGNDALVPVRAATWWDVYGRPIKPAPMTPPHVQGNPIGADVVSLAGPASDSSRLRSVPDTPLINALPTRRSNTP